ncbi:MobA/MobL family protein [Curvibacter sp. CHRR-16]|uniref:MobQ family relaxase n=1 Tax=Curvibacter sp. CHRR-16 TaxID=2835872 RepID=UPI001BDAFC9F|nr:MobQ family relaxase [Curvibacter sp. CHRR-16]MBT0571874.1 MobA/MobL family protein [Curvibacter sp. CHRR-16]
MAIYHFSAQIISRSTGRSAVAAASYRAGEKMIDKRTGEVFDYSKRDLSVKFKEIFTPDGSPEWMKDRSKLWNAVEEIEKRKDAQLAREIVLALPVELTRNQRVELLRNFVQEAFVQKGMVADAAIHEDFYQETKNPHAHIMLTTRVVEPNGFGQKERLWNDKQLLEEWRISWQIHANNALEKAGRDERIDHRTLAAQGIERMPTIHEGWGAEKTERKAINEAIRAYNENKALEAQREELLAELSGVVLQAKKERFIQQQKTIEKTLLDMPTERRRAYVQKTVEELEKRRLEKVRRVQSKASKRHERRQAQYFELRDTFRQKTPVERLRIEALYRQAARLVTALAEAIKTASAWAKERFETLQPVVVKSLASPGREHEK